MAVSYDWVKVAQFLAAHGAQHVKTKGSMSAYYAPRTGKYIRIEKLGPSTYEYLVFNSRAACGCD